ncbi:hypothetical protein T484DRAFT_1762848 [Baffinella frigidus]|nr:hypothetical protein T484DRAFT_1762848 [Cryptophyta sp. CCMP2293]
MQLHQEISRSKSESERLQIMARTNEGNSRLISQEYRTLSRQKEALEDEYRRMWHLEERKIKAISDDTRRGFDQLRGNVISGLEKLDLTNRAMLESVETLISLGSDAKKAVP